MPAAKYAKKGNDVRRFGGVRELVILRDNEQCIKCYISRKDHYKKYGKDLNVNHKDGNGRNAFIKNNDPSNLETLCQSCHAKADKYIRASKRNITFISEEIELIRNTKRTQKDLANLYGVSISTISLIRSKKTYNNV